MHGVVCGVGEGVHGVGEGVVRCAWCDVGWSVATVLSIVQYHRKN